MAWDVILTGRARRELEQLPKRDRRKIKKIVRYLLKAGLNAHAAMDDLQQRLGLLKVPRGGKIYYGIPAGNALTGCVIVDEDIVVGSIRAGPAKR